MADLLDIAQKDEIRPEPGRAGVDRAGKRKIAFTGTPEPGQVSKTSSQDCVRLTNWDALGTRELVQPETPAEDLQTARSAKRKGCLGSADANSTRNLIQTSTMKASARLFIFRLSGGAFHFLH